jgi:hypothetical protein
MTVKRVPHKLFATLAEAQRFASWVDARLGLPSGSDERALTRTAQELLAEPVLATVRTADEAEPDYSAWRRTP